MTNRSAIVGSTRRANTWCGMYALALVSGLDYDTVYDKMLRGINRAIPAYRTKRKYITGVLNTDMERTAKTIKCKIKFDKTKKVNLKNYLDHLDPNKIYIINITDHYVVLDTRTWELCDNQSQEWVPVLESKHSRCYVRNIAEVKNHKL